MVQDLPKLNLPKEVCTGCLISKQTRKPFSIEMNYSAKKLFELMHNDLCALIAPYTMAGNMYIFLLVDDYNPVIWTYMLKMKDEAFEAFKRFKAHVEDGMERKLRCLELTGVANFVLKSSLITALRMVSQDNSQHPIRHNKMA